MVLFTSFHNETCWAHFYKLINRYAHCKISDRLLVLITLVLTLPAIYIYILILWEYYTWYFHPSSLTLTRSTSPFHAHPTLHPHSYLFLSFFKKRSNWLPLVLPIYSWVCGHLPEYDRSTMSHALPWAILLMKISFLSPNSYQLLNSISARGGTDSHLSPTKLVFWLIWALYRSCKFCHNHSDFICATAYCTWKMVKILLH